MILLNDEICYCIMNHQNFKLICLNDELLLFKAC